MSCIACGRYLCDECDEQPCCCSTRPTEQTERLKDPKSTGRKRAAELYPLDRDAPCEWQKKKDCGGGKHPIIGCLNGKQSVRHHGPDKDTLNNEQGNVSRICSTCHVRWHALNDGDYDPTYISIPTLADDYTLLENEVNWKAGKYKDLSRKRMEFFHSD